MGIYRFILALLVIYSHSGRWFYGLSTGVIAVISFLLISGFVITKLIRCHYNSPNGIIGFYIDRAMRIYPQLILWISISAFIYVTILNKDITLTQYLVNVIALPLNFLVNINTNYIIVIQSWSLALELQFYIVIPLLLIWSKRKIAMYVSLLFFTLAYFGIVDRDYYGYRLLTGTLFIFLVGSVMAEGGVFNKHIISIYIYCVALLVLSPFIGVYGKIYIAEMLWGFVLGFPIVALLSKFRLGNADLMAGNISYAMYLNHKLIQYVIQYLGYDYKSWVGMITTVIISSILAYISYKAIELPFYKLRHRIRLKSDTKSI